MYTLYAYCFHIKKLYIFKIHVQMCIVCMYSIVIILLINNIGLYFKFVKFDLSVVQLYCHEVQFIECESICNIIFSSILIIFDCTC